MRGEGRQQLQYSVLICCLRPTRRHTSCFTATPIDGSAFILLDEVPVGIVEVGELRVHQRGESHERELVVV